MRLKGKAALVTGAGQGFGFGIAEAFVREGARVACLDIKGEVAEWNSQWSMVNSQSSVNCIIIDNIGMLSRLYQYATIAYIGGGFGYDGLHNVLEAAVYGKPLIFGPEYEKNFEAPDLIDSTGAISISNALELEKVVNQLLANEEELKNRGIAAKEYVYKNAGASKKIVDYIQANRLFTN